MSCFLGRVWEGFLAAWIHHKVKRERGAMLENTVAAHYCGLQLPPAWVNNLAQKKWRQSRTQRGCAHGDGGVRMVASFPRYCASSWFSLVSQNCQHWLGTAPLCYLGEDATCLQVLDDITSVDGHTTLHTYCS